MSWRDAYFLFYTLWEDSSFTVRSIRTVTKLLEGAGSGGSSSSTTQAHVEPFSQTPAGTILLINVTWWSHCERDSLRAVLYCTLTSACESRWSETQVTRASCLSQLSLILVDDDSSLFCLVLTALAAYRSIQPLGSFFWSLNDRIFIAILPVCSCQQSATSNFLCVRF